MQPHKRIRMRWSRRVNPLRSPPFPLRPSSSAEKETSKQHQSQPNPSPNALVCCVMSLLPMLDNVKLHIALMRIRILHILYTYNI